MLDKEIIDKVEISAGILQDIIEGRKEYSIEKLNYVLDALFLVIHKIDPIYCPQCGSCGEEGCCPPDMCKTVKANLGLYCESNLQSYIDLCNDWSRKEKQRKKYKDIARNLYEENITLKKANEVFKSFLTDEEISSIESLYFGKGEEIENT